MDRIVILVDTLPKGAFCYAKRFGSRGRASSLGLILVILNINIKNKGLLDHNMDDKIIHLAEIANELNLIRRVLEDLTNLMDRRTY